MKIGSPISNPIVTPVKHDAEDDDCNREAYHHRSDISDDFDLFDGELLRATEDDEVLAHAASRAEPSWNQVETSHHSIDMRTFGTRIEIETYFFL